MESAAICSSAINNLACLSPSSTDPPERDDSRSLLLLSKLSKVWSKRAQVKKEEFLEANVDSNKDDFLTELLPFNKHPDYIKLPEEQKKKILSCGWLIYNEKTVKIETQIVNPVCVDILSENIPGYRGIIYKDIVSQTMTDEAYHVLLVTKSSNITKELRGIDIHIPEFDLVKKMHSLAASYSEDWKRKLIRFATAVVSEIFVSDYLKLLSESEEIQPINRLMVETHRQDELAHRGIFTYLTQSLYQVLSEKERLFFASILPKPVQWFASRELEVWRKVLEQIGIPQVDNIIKDSYEISEKTKLESIDYSKLLELANEIGITDIPVGRDSFNQEGLIN